MEITAEQVEYVARLSRIAVTDEEKETFTQELAGILAYIEKLNELDTEGVEPLCYASGFVNVFRKDEVGESLPREEALANAPEQTQGHYRVPKILE